MSYASIGMGNGLLNVDRMNRFGRLRRFLRQGDSQYAVNKGGLDAVFPNAADREAAAEGAARPFFIDVVLLVVLFVLRFFMTGRQGQHVVVISQGNVFFGDAGQIRRQDVFVALVFNIDSRNVVRAFERFHEIAEEAVGKVRRKYCVAVRYNRE